MTANPSTASESSAVATTTALFRYMSAALAFLTWGGWAWYVNRNSETTSPLVSGLVHGAFSATITIVMMTSVTWLYRRLAAPGPKMMLPAVTTSVATGSFITTVHLLIGTANVGMTVIPGLLVAFCFNLITTRQLFLNDPTREQVVSKTT